MIELLLTTMLSIILQAQRPEASIQQKDQALNASLVVVTYLANEQQKIKNGILCESPQTQPPLVYTPPPVNTYIPPVVIGSQNIVEKEIVVDKTTRANQNGRFYDFVVHYLQDEVAQKGYTVTVTSDDDGSINSEGKAYSKSASQKIRRGVGRQGKYGAYFQYIPKERGERTITISVDGMQKQIVIPGQD